MKAQNLLGISLIALVACGKAGPTQPSENPNQPKPIEVEPIPASALFGFYAYGDLPDIGCGYTNWALVNALSVERAREKAEAAKACRVQVTYEPKGKWDWSQIKPIAQAFADAGVLHSIYVADEPLATGMSYSELSSRIAEVHAAGWKAFFTEELSGLDKSHPLVDYYGLDAYYLENGRPHPKIEAALARHPEVNVYVTYSFYRVGPSKCGFSEVMPDQREQVALARRHGLGVAIWTWLPSFGSGSCTYVGVGGDPETQAELRSLR